MQVQIPEYIYWLAALAASPKVIIWVLDLWQRLLKKEVREGLVTSEQCAGQMQAMAQRWEQECANCRSGFVQRLQRGDDFFDKQGQDINWIKAMLYVLAEAGGLDQAVLEEKAARIMERFT